MVESIQLRIQNGCDTGRKKWSEISIPGDREPEIIIVNRTLSYEVPVGEDIVYARALKTYEPLDGYKWVKTYKIKVQPYLTYNLLVRD